MTRSGGASDVTDLDIRTLALTRLGAAVAVGASSSILRWLGRKATLAGATSNDIVGMLLAIAPVIGKARLVSAAPSLALSIGYDIDRDLEGLA